MIKIFSVFHLPCFNYWNMKHLWILSDSWAAAWFQEVPCLKETSLADSGLGKICSSNLEDFSVFISPYQSEMVAILYFWFLRYILQSLITLCILYLLLLGVKKILETFSKRIIFNIYSWNKYSQTRPHQTVSILGRWL